MKQKRTDKHVDGYTIYQGKDGGIPEVHEPTKWYFASTDPRALNGEILGGEYDTREQAYRACLRWDAEISAEQEKS